MKDDYREYIDLERSTDSVTSSVTSGVTSGIPSVSLQTSYNISENDYEPFFRYLHVFSPLISSSYTKPVKKKGKVFRIHGMFNM